MSRKSHLLTLGLAIISSAPLAAQTPDWVARVLEASNLPISTSEARKEGASNEDITSILDVLQREKVPADEARQVIDEERAARREHGPVDNFGAFVQAKLAAGLRGQELAAAIRAEHAARGKGKGYDATRGREGQGKDADGKKPAQAGGKPEGNAGKADDAGKQPEGKGKPTDRPIKPRR